MPVGEVAIDQGLVQGAVAHRVGAQSVGVVAQKSVRPTRRGHHRHAPRRVAQDARSGRTQVHATGGRRRRRVKVQRVVDVREKPACGNDFAAIAVDGHGQGGVVPAFAVVVQIKNGIGEGVGQAGVVQGFVGVGHIKAGLDQAGGQVLAHIAASAQTVVHIGAFAPGIGFAAVHHGRALRMAPGVHIHVVVSAHGEGRDDVFFEVFVLVVSPDQHQVGVEAVEFFAHAPELRDHGRAVLTCSSGAQVVGPLSAHHLRPVGGVFGAVGDARVFEGGAQDARHHGVGGGQGRVVRQAHAQYFSHAFLLNLWWQPCPWLKQLGFCQIVTHVPTLKKAGV